MHKTYIATPIWRYYDVRAAHSLVAAIASRDPEEDIWWESIDGDALISRTRSQLATKFITEPELTDFDVMVILDDDVQFWPDDLYKLTRLAREKQEPVGGIYVTRSREPHPASMFWPGQSITFGPGQEPVTVRYLATGFMAIPKRVIETVLTHPGFETVHGPERIVYCEQGVGDIPMYDFFRPFCINEGPTLQRAGYNVDDKRVHYLSEDWAFCERARQCGFQIWADPSIILQHRATVSVTVADLGVKTGMLSADGAAGKGRSVLVVKGKEIGSQQDELVTTTQKP